MNLRVATFPLDSTNGHAGDDPHYHQRPVGVQLR